MAAYIVFETGHTFGPSMLYPVYRLVAAMVWSGLVDFGTLAFVSAAPVCLF